jgi:DNA-binding Lrp family transcriptional regulator
LSKNLTKFQKQLCNLLQDGLPICQRPFTEIAKILKCDELTVLEHARLLKEMGIIRRFQAIVNYRALGRISTLVAAHLPENIFNNVAKAVNSLESVSHNYRRDHYYNLWFTLQMQSQIQIESKLAELSTKFGTGFYSLPVENSFKLDVRFDAERFVMRGGDAGLAYNNIQLDDKPVKLNKNEKLILTSLQKGLKLVPEPFDFLVVTGKDVKADLEMMKQLVDKGVIRRIAAVLDHRRLGFETNVLFVCEIPRDRIIEAGRRLASLESVSHCYHRKVFEGWPYNLFGMMHARDEERIRNDIDKFVEFENVENYELLQTVTELKKQPVRYNL